MCQTEKKRRRRRKKLRSGYVGPHNSPRPTTDEEAGMLTAVEYETSSSEASDSSELEAPSFPARPVRTTRRRSSARRCCTCVTRWCRAEWQLLARDLVTIFFLMYVLFELDARRRGRVWGFVNRTFY